MISPATSIHHIVINGLDHFLMFNLINYLFQQISNEVLIFHFTGTIKALMNISPESETTIIF